MKLKDKTERIYDVKMSYGTYDLDEYFFERSVDNIIASLLDIKQELQDIYHTIYFEKIGECEESHIECFGVRKETPEEAKKRLDEAKKVKERKKKKKVKDLEAKKKELVKLQKEIARLEK